MFGKLALIPAIALFLAVSSAAQGDEVRIFAAASLKNALDNVATEFETATGHEVTISYAGSNALARQIIDGAPADIFVSANEAWMDEVEKAGLLVAGSRRDLLGNDLVLIAHDPGIKTVEITPDLDLSGLLDGGKLAMAMVDSVPAGQYGKAALEKLGLWDSVAADVAQAENVRAALMLVSLGEAPLGIVYTTDAAADDAVHVIGTFPADSHPPIVYPAARLTENAAAATFFDGLSADPAKAIFTHEGFRVLD